MISNELRLIGIAGPPSVGSTSSMSTVKVSAPTVAIAGVDVRARDDRELDAHVVVVDQISLAVGGRERVLRRLGQVRDRLDPVVGFVDVIRDARDGVDEEMIGVRELRGDRVVAAAVEGERHAGRRIGERALGSGGGDREGVLRMPVVGGCGRARPCRSPACR